MSRKIIPAKPAGQDHLPPQEPLVLIGNPVYGAAFNNAGWKVTFTTCAGQTVTKCFAIPDLTPVMQLARAMERRNLWQIVDVEHFGAIVA